LRISNWLPESINRKKGGQCNGQKTKDEKGGQCNGQKTKDEKGGQCNGQKTKDEKTNNTPQNTTQKTINLSKTNPTGSKLTFFKIRSKRLFVTQVFL